MPRTVSSGSVPLPVSTSTEAVGCCWSCGEDGVARQRQVDGGAADAGDGLDGARRARPPCARWNLTCVSVSVADMSLLSNSSSPDAPSRATSDCATATRAASTCEHGTLSAVPPLASCASMPAPARVACMSPAVSRVEVREGGRRRPPGPAAHDEVDDDARS